MIVEQLLDGARARLADVPRERLGEASAGRRILELEWLDAAGKCPAGFDLPTLEKDLAEIGIPGG